MPKFIPVIFILVLCSLGITPVKAIDTQISNTVHSSANGSNASNNVSITNNVGSSNNSSSFSNCTTNIVIDSNGEHKEYHGDCGNVDIRSGNNSVTISNSSSTSPSKTSSPNVLSATIEPSPTISPSASASASPSSIPTTQTNQQFDLIEFLKQEFVTILNILHKT